MIFIILLFPIHIAASIGNIERIYDTPIGVFHIPAADINRREDTTDQTPLMNAARVLDIPAIDLLLAQGAHAHLTAYAPTNHTALTLALLEQAITHGGLVGGGPALELGGINLARNDIIQAATRLIRAGVDVTQAATIEELGGRTLTVTEMANEMGFAGLIAVLTDPVLLGQNQAARAALGLVVPPNSPSASCCRWSFR